MAAFVAGGAGVCASVRLAKDEHPVQALATHRRSAAKSGQRQLLANADMVASRVAASLGRGRKVSVPRFQRHDDFRHCGLVQLESGPAVVGPTAKIYDLGALGCRVGGLDGLHDVEPSSWP